MKPKGWIVLWVLAAAAGCAQARKSPPMAAGQPQPVHRTWFDRTAESTRQAADATWNVVAAPVRWITPAKKPVPKPAATLPAVPPDAIIVQSDPDGVRPIMIPMEDAPATQPTTRPKTR